MDIYVEPSLQDIYYDCVTRLDYLLSGSSAFTKVARTDTIFSISTTCVQLRVWAADIDEENSQILQLLPITSPILAYEVRGGLLATREAIGQLKKHSSLIASDNENGEEHGALV